MEIAFDIISDLYLDPNDSFNWEGKPTSLYCVVAGNISSDLRTILQTLLHLSKFYQGIFYVPGSLEYKNHDIDQRTQELINLCSSLPKVALLYYHVVILNGIALMGANGWSNTENSEADQQRYEDIAYLNKSVEKLQKHLDVKKIILISNSVPKKELFFGEAPDNFDNRVTLDYCLKSDTEFKISHWIFGTYEKIVDTTIDNINYINNPYFKRRPYWAKRISVNI